MGGILVFWLFAVIVFALIGVVWPILKLVVTVLVGFIVWVVTITKAILEDSRENRRNQ